MRHLNSHVKDPYRGINCIEICLKHWLRVVNLLLCLTIGPFQKTHVDSQITFVNFVSLFSTQHWSSGNVMVGSQYYMCCCQRSLNTDYCYFIKPFLSFWFCFICSIGFGFLFFMLTPWFVAVMFWIWSLLYSVGLLVGHPLILLRLNRIEKFVISHGDICFSEDIMPAQICLLARCQPKRIGKYHQFWSQSICCKK